MNSPPRSPHLPSPRLRHRRLLHSIRRPQARSTAAATPPAPQAPARPPRAPPRAARTSSASRSAASPGSTRASTSCSTTSSTRARSTPSGPTPTLIGRAATREGSDSPTTTRRSPREHRSHRRRVLRLRPQVFPEHHPQGFPLPRLRQVQRDRRRGAQGQGARHGLLRLGLQQPRADHESQHCPNFRDAREIDVYGRRTTSPCFNHPDYRASPRRQDRKPAQRLPRPGRRHRLGLRAHGPAPEHDRRHWSTAATCFCEHCQAKARDRGISVPRAQTGLPGTRLGCSAPPRRISVPWTDTSSPSGALLLEYPEILSWEKLWTDSFQGAQAEMYGIGKVHRPAEALRLPHHAEHDFQPVLPGRRGLLAHARTTPTI